jgi:hypothetical protein
MRGCLLSRDQQDGIETPADAPSGGRTRSPAVRVTHTGFLEARTKMTRTMIRVDADMSQDITEKFPHLQLRKHRAQTTLSGDIEDQEELQGVLNYLSLMGITVVEVVTIPE